MTEDVWKQLDRMRRELTHIQRPLLEAMIDHHKAVVIERDAALARLNTLVNAAECNIADVENLCDSDAKEVLVNLCRMILEETRE